VFISFSLLTLSTDVVAYLLILSTSVVASLWTLLDTVLASLAALSAILDSGVRLFL
jgi:hypothetical protein